MLNCFCRSSLRLQGHPRPVVRSTEYSTNLPKEFCAYSDDVNPVLKKEFLPGYKHWLQIGMHIRRNRVLGPHPDILSRNCIKAQNPIIIKNSIVELSFQIGFLGQDQSFNVSVKIFKGCRSDHIDMGNGAGMNSSHYKSCEMGQIGKYLGSTIISDFLEFFIVEGSFPTFAGTRGYQNFIF